MSRSYKKGIDNLNIIDNDDREENKHLSDLGVGYMATKSAAISTKQAAVKFAKPDTYNRKLYDSGIAKLNAKKNAFKNGKIVKDPYTGDVLTLTKSEAKKLYGDNWAQHLAESDHVESLNNIYKDTKNNSWNTVDDIKAAANCDENIVVTSRKYNNAKRGRSNKEFVEDKDYIEVKGIKVTKEGKERAIKDGEIAKKSIDKSLKKSAFKNVVETGHEAGKMGAKSAGATALTMSGIMNLVAVVKGEKSGDEAIVDTLKDGGKGAVSGYVMGGGLTVISHTLSNSSSQFIQGLVNSNVPGKVITAIIATGDTLKKFGKGEISLQECALELGESGLNMVTMGYSMAVGQALIPIPVIGGAIGALVGSMLTSTYYNKLIGMLQTKELEHKERQRIIAECKAAAEQTKAFREELEVFLQSYFKEYRECFDSALSSMHFSYEVGDADGVIASANEITRKLGGQVYFDSVEEFKDYLKDDSIDIL